MGKEKPLWKGKTGGGNFGQKSLLIMFRFLPVRVGYFFVALAVPFYMLFRRSGYQASFNYFHKRLKQRKIIAFKNTARNHYRFGQIIIDRFVVLAKKRSIFQIEIEGSDLFKELLSQKEGFLMVSSHVGNFELLGYLYPQEQKTIYSMIYGNEVAAIQQARKTQFGMNNIQVISADESMNHIFLINNALANGGIVNIPADRIFGSQKSVTCNFLHGRATFPLGPFVVAAIHNIPVLAVFVMKVSAKKYKLHLQLILSDRERKTTKLKAESLLLNFTKELETIVKQYPEQWFNFYEFWESDEIEKL